MLAPKVDKKKILQYSAVLGVILLITLYVVFTNFVSFGESEAEVQQKKNTLLKNTGREVKNFDNSLIEDDKFKELKENRTKEKTLDELEVGKENPFEDPSKKNEVIKE